MRRHLGQRQFVFVAGPTPDSWTVQLNGVDRGATSTRAPPSSASTAAAATIPSTITGTTGTEKIEMWPDHTILTADSFTFTTANIETVNFTGVGGTDQAIFHDSGSETPSPSTPTPSPALRSPGRALP